jgi:hypothetical protein
LLCILLEINKTVYGNYENVPDKLMKWLFKLTKHLKKAQSSNIKYIRCIGNIERCDFHINSRECESKDDCYIYEIFLEKDTFQYVNFVQINDIIEGEEWLQGEVDC